MQGVCNSLKEKQKGVDARIRTPNLLLLLFVRPSLIFDYVRLCRCSCNLEALVYIPSCINPLPLNHILAFLFELAISLSPFPSPMRWCHSSCFLYFSRSFPAPSCHILIIVLLPSISPSFPALFYNSFITVILYFSLPAIFLITLSLLLPLI